MNQSHPSKVFVGGLSWCERERAREKESSVSRHQRLFSGRERAEEAKLPKRARRAVRGPRRRPRAGAEYQGVFHIHSRRWRAALAWPERAQMSAKSWPC